MRQTAAGCILPGAASEMEFGVQDVYQGVSLPSTRVEEGKGGGTGHREKMCQPMTASSDSAGVSGVFLQSCPELGQNCPLRSLVGRACTRVRKSLQLNLPLKQLMTEGCPLRSLAESGAHVLEGTWATCLHVHQILPLMQMLHSYRCAS